MKIVHLKEHWVLKRRSVALIRADFGVRVLTKWATIPRVVQATLDRWKTTMEMLGFEYLDNDKVPAEGEVVTYPFNNMVWDIEQVAERSQTRTLPPAVYARLLKAKEYNVPIQWYLWCKERYPHPNFRVANSSSTAASRHSMAPIPTSLQPAPTGRQVDSVTLSSLPTYLTFDERASEFFRKLLDPALVVVIPTDIKNMVGLWFLVGCWPDE
jgi:hypothetical protein